MTRTYLIQVAQQIKRKPVESYNDSSYFGTVYTGLFLKKAIHCFFEADEHTERLIAVYYKNTLYCINPVSIKGALAIKNLYNTFNCTQKVMLYPNKSNILFQDEEGDFRNKHSCEISQAIDYADVIPVPNA